MILELRNLPTLGDSHYDTQSSQTDFGSPPHPGSNMWAYRDAEQPKINQPYLFLLLQVLLRHLIQLGHIVIPKSVSQHRLKENISVFDFKLTKVEMAQLELLDQKKRTFDFGFVKGDMDPRKLPAWPGDEL